MGYFGDAFRFGFGSVGTSYDSDAQAFLTAAGITDPTLMTAVDDLVVGLKAQSLWTLMNAVYPFVGGSASAHKWNLKDPRDLDAAYRLSFSSGWTHASTGATPSTAYADTFLAPDPVLGINSNHLSVYTRTTGAGAVDIGCFNPSNSPWDIEVEFGNVTYHGVMASNTYISVATPGETGLFTGSRTASNIVKLYRNGSEIATGSTVSSVLPTYNVYIGARNNANTAEFHTGREIAFATIGAGLDATQASNLYTLVQAFQTALSRNV